MCLDNGFKQSGMGKEKAMVGWVWMGKEKALKRLWWVGLGRLRLRLCGWAGL